MEFSIQLLALLFAVGCIAGLIDSIAGGGGLLALPVLMSTGMSPLQALATNKLQGSFGTATASLNFLRHGQLVWQKLKLAFVMSFTGSVLGTLSVQYLVSDWLNQIIPILLVIIALYFWLAPPVDEKNAKQRLRPFYFGLLIGSGIGYYDGFFGPGTGTFFMLGFVLLLGYPITKATAGTKLLNFASNIGSLLPFALAGQVIWLAGIVMGIGQILGAWVGSHLVVNHGGKFIRPLLVMVTLVMAGKLLWEQL